MVWSHGRRVRAVASATVDAAGRSLLALPVLVALTVGLLAPAAPAAAADALAPKGAPSGPVPGPVSDEERLAVYDEALVSLTQELSYVVLLGWAVTPVPLEARDMPGAIGIDRMGAADMIDAVRYLDEQRGPGALARLREIDARITPPIELVLGTNIPIVAGELPQIGVGVYLEAYEQLLEPWAELRAAVDPAASQPLTSIPSTSSTPLTTKPVVTNPPATQPAATQPVVTSPEATQPVVTNPAGTSGEESGDAGSPGLPAGVVIGFVVALALTAGVVIGRRIRRRRPPLGRSPEPVLSDDLLDAGRTIMAAVDLDAFAVVVAEQIRRLTGSDGAVVIDGDVRNPAGRPMPAGAALDRATATGRPVHADGTTIVPVVADGRVVGALIAWTGAPQDADVLGAFAPLVGASLLGLRSRIEHEHLAFGDALTGVGNRRRFDRDLDRLVGADSGRGTQVALAMVDVDHFKRFNDTHGHPVGDAALRHVAAVIAANVREGDLVYRYGGEEFAILLPDTSLDEAHAVLDRIRVAVAAAPLRHGSTDLPAVTVSVGLSGTPPVDGPSILRTADGALYAAKSNGRNRVEICPAP